MVSVKLGELEAAKDTFEKTLDMAMSQGDKAAESAIRKAIEDINQTIKKRTDPNGKKFTNFLYLVFCESSVLQIFPLPGIL